MDFSQIFSTFTALTDPVPSAQEERYQRKLQQTSDADKGKLTEKDLYTLLKDAKGLPNEVDDITRELIQSIQFDTLYGTGDLETMASRYVQLVSKLKKLEFNQKEYEEARKLVLSNNAENDYAIDRYGNLLLVDKDNPGSIVRMNYRQWMRDHRDDSNYMPLTNGNLLWYRYNSPTEVYDNALYSITNNGIGLPKIVQLIKESFKNLGTTETENDSLVSSYVKQGAQELQQLLAQGPEGYYKVTSKLKGTDGSKIKSTLKYIYSTLPNNAKIRLALQTKYGTEDEVVGLLFNALSGQIDTTQSMTLNYLGSEEKTSGKKSKGSSKELGDVTANSALQWASGLGMKRSFVINLGGIRNVQADANVAVLTDSNDKELGVNSSLQAASAGSFSNTVDFTQASMGGKTINPNLYDTVLTDGYIASIDFPCYTDSDGTLKPDLRQDVWDRVSKANLKIRKLGININSGSDRQTHYKQINDIYKEFKLDPPYDENGNVVSKSWHRFGVINGRTNEKALNMEKAESNPLLTVETNQAAIDQYLEISKFKGWDKGGIFSSSDDLLYGTIWIPYYNNHAGLMRSGNMNQANTANTANQISEIRNNYVHKELGK